MALMKTDGSGLSPQYQTLFDKQLLSYAKPMIVMAQFAQKKSFPKNKGATSMKFFRPSAPDRSRVVALAEGVPPAQMNEIVYTPITVDMVQIGEPFRFSDVLSNTDLFSTADQVSRLCGEDAAVYADFACTSELAGGIAAANRRYGSGAADYATFDALSNANGKLTIQDLLGAYTRLTITKARKPEGGAYATVVSPQLSYDIKLDSKFIDAGIRGNNKGLFNGEVGTWYGNRIMETTEGWIEAGGAEGTYDASGDNFGAFVLGRELFGAPIMAGQSPFSPSLIVVNRPDSANPLNQFTSIGWKGYWAVKTLNDQWGVKLLAKSTYA